MKRLSLVFAFLVAALVSVAQSQFYVIMKDGSAQSYPVDKVDSLTFDEQNGDNIYGFDDIVKRLVALEKDVDSLKNVLANYQAEADDSMIVNGHKYVDLGLPSGTLWATTNVGAKKPEEYGIYFAWGETEPKNMYSLTSSKWENKSDTVLREEFVIDNNNNLLPRYDAASVYWGEEWMSPDSTMIRELIDNCSYVWTEKAEVNGILFIGLNGNTLFLPVAGMKRDGDDVQVGSRGYYASSTCIKGEGSASYMYLSQDRLNCGSSSRAHGRTIRPVLRK